MWTWIARFSFTFLISGIFLVYRAYQWQQGRVEMSAGLAIAFVVIGALCLALGAQGIKERHRRNRDV